MSTKKNTLYNIGYRLFSTLLPIITAPYLSRVVGQTWNGLYAYTWTISYIICLIAMLGLENYGVRAIAEVRDDIGQRNRIFSEIYSMQLLVASLCLVGYAIYAFFVAGEEQRIAIPLTLMSVSCLVNLDWCLMGLDQFRAIALRNTFVKVLAAASVFVLVKEPEDIRYYGLVWSAATVAGCLMSAASLKGRIQFVRVPFRDAMRHFLPCAGLFVSVIAVTVYRQMDKVMVGAISSMEQNALYEYAEKIIYCLSGFISAIGSVMLPRAAHMMSHGQKDRVPGQIGFTMHIILCMVCGMAFGVAAVAPDFARLFYGESFLESGTLMVPLAFTLITIGFANVIRTHWVLPAGRDSVLLRSVLTGAAVNLLVNLLLIPSMGAMGAVAGTLAAETAVPFVQWLCLRKELDYRPYIKTMAVYVLFGGIMLGALLLLSRVMPSVSWLTLSVRVLCGMLLYGILCLAYWILTRKKRLLRLIPVIGRRFHI